MRKIPAALAVLGLTALGLTGCAIPAGTEACPRPASPESTALDAVSVSGDVGQAPDVSVPTPFHADEVAFHDLVTGEGQALGTEKQLAVLDLTIIGGSSGDEVTATQYDGDLSRVGALESLSQAVPAFGEALQCATEGSRILIAVPPSDIQPEVAASLGLGEDESAVAVVDLEKVYLGHAEGTYVYNDALGLPTVVRAPDGRPGIIVPDATAPDELSVQTLIKGDGAEVTGDQPVRVAYTGVTWAEREVFDSSWDAAPISVTLDGVVPGFAQALEGATVGSQLLVVIPPDLGYGDQEQASIPAGSTLVFVIDILGLDQAPTP